VSPYDPLRDYLMRQTRDEFTLGFEAIEEILGFALPRAADRASWWETERSPQVAAPQRVACLEAGFLATRAKEGDAVRFKRKPKRR
jgi:hypothetical protein